MWSRKGRKLDVDVSGDSKAQGQSVKLIKYDAFSTPTLKRNYEITSQKLVTTQQYLDETCKSFRDLEHRLTDQESRFQSQAEHLTTVTEENNELKSQLSRVSEQLTDTRKNALAAEERNRGRTEELEARLSELVAAENELREKTMENEMAYSDRIKAGQQRERELQDRIQRLDNEMEMLRIQTDTREKELLKKIELMQEESEVVLRSQSMSEETNRAQVTIPHHSHHSSYRHSSPMKLSASAMEAESLRSVLDLKMAEISELRRQNQDLRKTNDELGRQQVKTSSLESKVEDLQFQLNEKAKKEVDLMEEVKSLSDKAHKEAKQRTRLSIHNEELQWKLKQNSERHQKTLQEFSRSLQDKSMLDDMAMVCDAGASSEDLTVSPPSSPKIKGVVKTSDAVSWILEMDDESPGQVASRAIRRVGSFRSTPTNALKRSKSSSQSPMTTPNPLSQSASATSFTRQFSAETSPMKTSSSVAASTAEGLRCRSQSMSVKSSAVAVPVPESRTRRTLSALKSTNMSKSDLMDTSFQRPMHSSSPYKHDNGSSAAVELICAANTGEKRRLSIKNLSFTKNRPSMSSMAKDVLPLESAGEAMMLQISDGEDLISQNSSLTASTSSNSSSSAEEETTAEKERTAISIKQQSQKQQQQSGNGVEGEGEVVEEEGEAVFTSLQKSGNSGSSKNNSRSINLINSERRENWSPRRLLGDVAMEEEEEDALENDVFGRGSESSESVV